MDKVSPDYEKIRENVRHKLRHFREGIAGSRCTRGNVRISELNLELSEIMAWTSFVDKQLHQELLEVKEKLLAIKNMDERLALDDMVCNIINSS